MILFNDQPLETFLKTRLSIIQRTINGYSNSDLLHKTLDKHIASIVKENKINIPTINERGMTVSTEATKLTGRELGDNPSVVGQLYDVDLVTYQFPLFGDSSLLKLKSPKNHIIPVAVSIELSKYELLLIFRYRGKILGNTDVKNKIAADMLKALSVIKANIESMSNEISDFETHLNENIRPLLEKRISQAQQEQMDLADLNPFLKK